MGIIIHAKKDGNEIKYRLWSTFSDSYITDEGNEEEVKDVLLKMEIEKAIDNFNMSIKPCISRAKSCGSSSMIGAERIVEDEWEQERN